MMTYFKAMAGLLRLNNKTLFSPEISLKSLQFFCALNVGILGLLYGLSASYFSAGVIAEKGVDGASISGLKIALAGIPVAFLMHAGAALFIWVFLRAIGGKANFLTSYFFIGIATISLWPIAPFAAAFQVQALGNYHWIMAMVATLFTCYAFVVNYTMIQQVYRLTRVKMAIATSVTVVYISCFLYLWV